MIFLINTIVYMKNIFLGGQRFMNLRGLLSVPKNGEKQHYLNRPEWRWYQKYMPEDLRIEGEYTPTEEWWDFGEHEIHLDRYTIKNPKAKMLLFHGAGGNGRVLGAFARMAMRAGFEVVAPDFPGYGLTVRLTHTKPTYALWSKIGSALIDEERKRDGLPVILWGLSLGGFLAYMAAAENQNVDGLIATTLADTRRFETTAKAGRKLLGGGGYILVKLVGSLLDPIRLPMKWLSPMELISNDPEVSRVFMKDRLAGGTTVTMGFLRSLINVKLAHEPEDFNVCPVLLVHPAIDPWTPLELSMQFFNRIKSKKELVVLEGCGHFPVEEPGRFQLEEALARFVTQVTEP